MRLRLLLLLLLGTVLSCGAAEPSDADDEDTDSVPYMIVVEHAEGRRCAGALVSLRTALSSVRCARPRDWHAPLWALAAELVAGRGSVRTADGARRVLRLALAGPAADIGDPLDVEELALLALDEPFGESARSRPILMATAAAECDAAPGCNTVTATARLAAPAGPPSLRLRVLDVQRAPPAFCAARLRHWAAAKERALCFSGGAVCESDLGGGVVCAGLLCGVLSALGEAAKGQPAVCGEVSSALAIARRRRFLHCAHTERLCGIGDCKALCTERWLDAPRSSAAPAGATGQAPAATVVTSPAMTAARPSSAAAIVKSSRRRGVLQQRRGNPLRQSARPAAVPSRTPLVYELRLAADFEPNRADFKAGEYGDNAADYGALPDDALPPQDSTTPRVAAPRPAPTTARAERAHPLAQPQTDAQQRAPKTSRAPCCPLRVTAVAALVPFFLIIG